MDLDIHQLRVFIEVVRSGSFSKAGEKLNLSQSAVSQSIGKLEKQLNLMKQNHFLQLTKISLLKKNSKNNTRRHTIIVNLIIKRIKQKRKNSAPNSICPFDLHVFVCGFLASTDALRS